MNNKNFSYLDNDSTSFKRNFLKSNFYIGLSRAKENEYNNIEIDEIMKKKFKLNRLADYISNQEKSLEVYRSTKKLKKLQSLSKNDKKNKSPHQYNKKKLDSSIKVKSPPRDNVANKRKSPKQIA